MSFIQDSHKMHAHDLGAHETLVRDFELHLRQIRIEFAPRRESLTRLEQYVCSVVPCFGLSRRCCCGVRPTPIHPLCLRTLRALSLLPFRVLRINELEMRPVSWALTSRAPRSAQPAVKSPKGLRNWREVRMQSGQKGRMGMLRSVSVRGRRGFLLAEILRTVSANCAIYYFAFPAEI